MKKVNLDWLPEEYPELKAAMLKNPASGTFLTLDTSTYYTCAKWENNLVVQYASGDLKGDMPSFVRDEFRRRAIKA